MDCRRDDSFENCLRVGTTAKRTFIVFAWLAFWWLDHYPGLNRYLRSRYRCVVHNERVAVFDLRVETVLSARCEVPGALGL
jgi:hypothetical protein